MAQLVVNGQVFDGKSLLSRKAVLIEGKRITSVLDSSQMPAQVDEVYDLKGGTLIPGFIDLQVNGGGGVLFNAAPTVDSLRTIGAAHRRFGTTGFLPTLITTSFEVMRQAVEAVADAMAKGVPGVLGIHLEGPFLNSQRRGVHDASKFSRLDREGLEILTSLPVGKTLVTLAPELTSPEMINCLVEKGVDRGIDGPEWVQGWS